MANIISWNLLLTLNAYIVAMEKLKIQFCQSWELNFLNIKIDVGC